MRDIKFRLWVNTDDGMQLVYLDKIDCDNGLWFNSEKHLDYPESIMQYTGLKDRNGIEIWEGDIVKWGDLPNSNEIEIRIATVEINPCIQFNCKNIRFPYIFKYAAFAYSSNQLQVLGNIYQNPELLQ